MNRQARTATHEADLRTCERWFAQQGVPHFISGYNARRDVLTRMALFLAVVFVLEPVLPLRYNDPTALRLLAGGAIVALLVAGVAIYNRGGGRPAFAPPRRVGLVAVAVFVLLPPLEALLLSGGPSAALALLGINLLIVAIAYLVTSYGMVWTTWWATKQAATQFRHLVPLAARALPLLLIIMLLTFFTQEVWLIAGTAQWGTLAVALLLLVGLGFGLLLVAPPPDTAGPEHFESWASVAAAAAGTPAAAMQRTASEPPPALPLTTGMIRNIRVMQIVAASVRVGIVTALSTASFVVFGMLLLNPQTINDITGYEVRGVLWTWDSPIGVMVLSVELLVAALFTGILSGLQFIISTVTDSGFDEQLGAAADLRLRAKFAVLHIYLQLLSDDVAEPRA